MNKKKLLLILQSLLCAALAILVACAVIGVYREGAADRAEHPLDWIYTREATAERLAPAVPVLFVSLAVTAAGLVLGVRDERADRGKINEETRRELAASRTREPGEAVKKERRRRTLRIVLLAAALLLILAGIRNGSARDVLVKAVGICTECVGLG